MTYEEALTYLEGCSSFGIKPGLERIEALLDVLGHPEKAYKTIHITGTNGKGSVTSFVDTVLVTSGIRTGRYTSPHLVSYTERFCVNNCHITEDAFGAVIGKVAQAVETVLAQGVESPTQFEILTAAAFLFFKEQEVEYAVIEVGLGGLLDSTNVIVPEVAVITNVTVDHQQYCGTTVEEIATHKAGIIKEGVPTVTAAQGGALDVIEAKAKEMKSPLYVFNRDFTIESRSASRQGQMITWQDKKGEKSLLFTGLAGIHQSVNLACATMVIRILMKTEKRISDETMREGLARTKWAGRFEISSVEGRTIIFDGAHNANGAEAFSMTYRELFKETPKRIVMAILADKDIGAIVGGLVGPHDEVYTVPAPTPRSSDPEELARKMPCHARAFTSVSAGLEAAMEQSHEGDIIVVAGSLYILGEASEWLAHRQKH